MILPILYFSMLLLFIGIQLYLWYLWKMKNTAGKDRQNVNLPSVTVLIPVRNEEKNIGACLYSILQQNYPTELLEVIVINDHSTDRTVEVAGDFSGVRLINQSENNQGKKAALQTGIGEATGEIVMTTDGDCTVGEEWIISMVRMLGQDTHILVTGPVWMVPDKPGFIQRYQEMEQAALNVLTYSGLRSGLISSANGANLAYHRALYQDLKPYADNHHFPSGDDVFFAQKVHQSNGRVVFAKQQESMVFTNPATAFSGFINQRTRWAGKASGYTHWPTKFYMIVFAAINLFFVLLFITGFWHPVYFSYLFTGFLLKFVVDYLIIHTGMQWGHRTVCWQDVFKASLFQIGYVVYVSFLVMAGTKNRWKGGG